MLLIVTPMHHAYRLARALTSSITTVAPDAALSDVSRTLLDHCIGAVPVVDNKRRPIGIGSYIDVLRARRVRPGTSIASREVMATK